MKIMLYGTGKRFCSFVDSPFYIDELARHSYQVIGVCDKKKAGEMVAVGDSKFLVGGQADCLYDDIDRIVITSDKYFEEIAGELVALGAAKENSSVCVSLRRSLGMMSTILSSLRENTASRLVVLLLCSRKFINAAVAAMM